MGRALAAYNPAQSAGKLIGIVLVVLFAVMLINGGAKKRQRLQPPSMVAAGWFPDPEGKARLRYWDGARWTNHTAD
jgi:hypothetical protein